MNIYIKTSSSSTHLIPRKKINKFKKIKKVISPNVDFYSGIVLRAMGIPTNMFTVMFAIGRLPGWIAQWKEDVADPEMKISRPRQIYTGSLYRDYMPMDFRG